MNRLYIYSFLLVLFYIVFWLLVLTIFNIRITEHSPTFPFVWTEDNHLKGGGQFGTILVVTIFISFFVALVNNKINNNTQDNRRFLQSFYKLKSSIVRLYFQVKNTSSDPNILKYFENSNLMGYIHSYIYSPSINSLNPDYNVTFEKTSIPLLYWSGKLTLKLQKLSKPISDPIMSQLDAMFEKLDGCKSKSKIIYPYHIQNLLYVLAGFILFIWVPVSWAIYSWLFGTIMIIFLSLVFVFLLYDNTDAIKYSIYYELEDLDASLKTIQKNTNKI